MNGYHLCQFSFNMTSGMLTIDVQDVDAVSQVRRLGQDKGYVLCCQTEQMSTDLNAKYRNSP